MRWTSIREQCFICIISNQTMDVFAFKKNIAFKSASCVFKLLIMEFGRENVYMVQTSTIKILHEIKALRSKWPKHNKAMRSINSDQKWARNQRQNKRLCSTSIKVNASIRTNCQSCWSNVGLCASPSLSLKEIIIFKTKKLKCKKRTKFNVHKICKLSID